VHDTRGFTIGEAVNFDIDASRISLFDSSTGQRL
jgi:hypothetical protein